MKQFKFLLHLTLHYTAANGAKQQLQEMKELQEMNDVVDEMVHLSFPTKSELS